MLLIILLTISAVSCLPRREPLCNPEDEYACKNGSCIPIEWMCDNIPDCLKGEDEIGCHYLHECPKDSYMCRNGECLPKDVKCDGHFNCSDGSDEHGCRAMSIPQPLLTHPLTSPSLCHLDDEYTCNNGSCIPIEWMCDNVPDCLKGEDEIDCHHLTKCPNNSFMCRSGECLSKDVKCNGHSDCSDGSDEHGCKVLGTLSQMIHPLSSSPSCHPENEYSCNDGSCIPAEWMCDNVPDCLNGEDEGECDYLHKCPENSYMCRSGECLSKDVKCDGHLNCSDGSDEYGCNVTSAPTSSFSTPPTINPSEIDEESYTLWVYLLYMILALILISSICIGFYYCVFIPRRRINDGTNVKFVVMEEDERFAVQQPY